VCPQRCVPLVEASNKPIDRWLGLFALAVGVALYLLPKTEIVIIGCCILIWVSLLHPFIKFWWVENRKWRQWLAAAVLTVGAVSLAYNIKPEKTPEDQAKIKSEDNAPTPTKSESTPLSPPSGVADLQQEPPKDAPQKGATSKPKHQEKQNQQAPMSQECAPGANCAMSNGQQGGVTAGQVIVNPPVNPNRRVVVYDCIGSWRSTGPGENTFMQINTCLPDKCEKIQVFNDMMALNNAAAKEKDSDGKTDKYSELRIKCEQEIRTTPDWLTPYLFCGLADAGIGDVTALKTRMAYYDQHTGVTYDTGECKNISEYLHNALKNQSAPDGGTTSNPPVKLQNSPGSAVSINQHGGVTAGIIYDYVPPQRMIEPKDKTDLIAALSQHPGKVTVGAFGTDPSSEPQKFARMIQQIFHAAGWTMVEQGITPVYSSQPWSGVTVEAKGKSGDPVPANTAVVIRALHDAHIKPISSTPHPEWTDDTFVLVVVGANP
jgi:hypothetical protein